MKRTTKVIIGMLVFGLLAQLAIIVWLSTQLEVAEDGVWQINNKVEVIVETTDD